MDYAATFAALEAVRQRQDAGAGDIHGEFEQRAARERPVAYSNIIRLVCGLDNYERVKELLMESESTEQRRYTHKEYCYVEEQFARQTCELLLDHYAQEHQRRLTPSDLLDEDPPSLLLIKRLWEEHSFNAQQATPSPCNSPPPSPPRPLPSRATKTRSNTHAALPPSSRTRSKTQMRPG